MVNKFVYIANLKGTADTHIVEPLKSRSIRYKIIGMLLSLIVVILISVFPLSRAIDYQVDTISATTELKHLTDRLVLTIVEQTEVERTFFLTRSQASEQQFTALSTNLIHILEALEKNTANNQRWSDWYKQVNLAILERDEFLKNLMAIARTLPKDSTPSLDPTIEDNIRTGNVIKLMLSFIENEERLLRSNYQRLNVLRTVLNYTAVLAIILSLFLTYFVNNKFRRNIRQLKAYHDQLVEENQLLEIHVQERTTELEKATQHAQKERQRVEFLLQDASHRIGNSLATASSLLSIQINQSKSDEIKTALSVARDHIQTLATAHRRLRLSEDMDTADTKDFFETVIKDIVLSLPQQRHTSITIKTHIESFKISARDATTLAIIIGELITNSVKHAFSPNVKGTIEVILHEEENGDLNLIIEDDGRGFPEILHKPNGLGVLIISKLCGQFDVTPIFENRLEGGARTIIKLKNLAIRNV
ncbi:sensor histidine kinase (plasmid) [Bartonella sp. HY329]|uniref:sensor histidine kinase n=1 Tax=unclassified Bartonella TaxID=2645622 RepID=UPI0021C8A1A6|nr:MULTISPECIES: sensor histidine kinase [unclassified Bartonella]UXM96492.1 sensor histidine kinase [Bartonella sp. HY329]UXN10815.1 sensor histidine kinase [Bartonella sp. HY328]